MGIEALKVAFHGAAGDAQDATDVRRTLALLHPPKNLKLSLGNLTQAGRLE
jgi:hypothetical protein